MDEAAMIVLVLTIGAVATFLPRALGVLLSGRVSAESAVIGWITAVAYALLAALIGRIIVLPIGSLAELALWERLAAVGFGAIAFAIFRRSMPIAVAVAVTVLIAFAYARA